MELSKQEKITYHQKVLYSPCSLILLEMNVSLFDYLSKNVYVTTYFIHIYTK